MVSLSIIVPIYNVEKYLEKCIKTILSQTYKDFELILVDDGSPDKCGIICDEYLKLDNRIRVVHKKNGGLSSARNAGLKIATGEYVAFVDSDDWIEKNMYKKLYREAKKNNGDIVQCKFLKVNEEYTQINNNKIGNINIINNLEALNNLYNERYIETVVTWNKIYRRCLFDNIIFPEGKIHEDEFTTHKLLYKANKVVLIDEELYYYRQTPNSIMNSGFNIKRLDGLEAISQRMEFFKQIRNKDLYEKTLRKYEYILKKNYFMCESSLHNKNILKKIRTMYKDVFSKYILSNKTKIKEKIMSIIFFISPRAYKNIQTLRGKEIY
jgi:glycosyltransferase involved in cell wall biosynthesis